MEGSHKFFLPLIAYIGCKAQPLVGDDMSIVGDRFLLGITVFLSLLHNHFSAVLRAPCRTFLSTEPLETKKKTNSLHKAFILFIMTVPTFGVFRQTEYTQRREFI
jgi:hypothetical protein